MQNNRDYSKEQVEKSSMKSVEHTDEQFVLIAQYLIYLLLHVLLHNVNLLYMFCKTIRIVVLIKNNH